MSRLTTQFTLFSAAPDPVIPCQGVLSVGNFLDPCEGSILVAMGES